MTDVKKGDRVRITFEGEADEYLAGITYGTHEAGDRNFEVRSDEGDTVTIEKIEPPVEVFGPGDLLRTTHDGPPAYYYLAENGYVRLVGGGYGNVTPFYEYDEGDVFTSKEYEKVDLAGS